MRFTGARTWDTNSCEIAEQSSLAIHLMHAVAEMQLANNGPWIQRK